MRQLAADMLPDGQILICFDSSGSALTTWGCNNTATRATASSSTTTENTYSISENIFTVKVSWNNLYSNEQQVFALQFTGQCTNGGPTFCGN